MFMDRTQDKLGVFQIHYLKPKLKPYVVSTQVFKMLWDEQANSLDLY